MLYFLGSGHVIKFSKQNKKSLDSATVILFHSKVKNEAKSNLIKYKSDMISSDRNCKLAKIGLSAMKRNRKSSAMLLLQSTRKKDPTKTNAIKNVSKNCI